MNGFAFTELAFLLMIHCSIAKAALLSRFFHVKK